MAQHRRGLVSFSDPNGRMERYPRFFLALIVAALLGSSIWLLVLLLSLTYRRAR